MKPQKQKICSKNNGDCFRACVASMLELQNDDNLPNPHGDDWLTKWLKWFGDIGLRLSWHHKSIWRDGFWIASVPSKNFENTTHAIIMRGLHVFFDPSLYEKYQKGTYMLKSELVSGGWWIEIDDMHKFKDFMEKQEQEGCIMEWISVEERLPKKSRQYWCYDIHEALMSGSCIPWVDWFDCKSGNFRTYAEDVQGRPCAIKDYSVTHWAEMVLPDPPKGE
ncbi:MAG: DUF551 domain-containing protein [Thermotogota bacterium]|nr:DUF551 domain-containing protein [Thermotogota bacterium]